MYVIKRNGSREEVQFDKVTARIKKLCYELDTRYVDPVKVAMQVVQGIYDGVTTTELDNLAAETAAGMAARHPDFAKLAARIAVSNLHKNTNKSFSQTIEALYRYTDPKTGEPASLISEETFEAVMAHRSTYDSAIIYDRDYDFEYFGFKTLERSYLLKMHGKVVERPQHMFMRVAAGIHGHDVKSAIETYNLMSERWFIHATPTLFNAGTPKPQLSSCFLISALDDSIEGIYETLKKCALISQSAGGIGLSIHNIRATGSYIKGTNGNSNGIVPMLRVFNDTARYVDQGGGKRKGAFAIYLEPWHADIFEFLELKKNHGQAEMRARDLFYALWIPDLFMKRVRENGTWSLFCPNEAPGLHECWGEEFERLYTQYEAEGRQRRTVEAQKLWFKVLEMQIESGTPYLLYKDHANRKSNQQNLGTIRSSNLCTEIIEYTAADEVAVCNLASLALSRFVKADGTFDHEHLSRITRVVTRNLNQIIDINFYPVPEARKSNFRHRPIGIGVQGLADAFVLMRLPFDSAEARRVNREIFETLYYAALTASCELAREHGPYETYAGSPASEGRLQFDLWGETPGDRWDWAALKADIQRHGLRNSLLLAPMPTASTSQILGNNECFEPFTSNLYTRRTLSGEFIVVNRYLMNDLVKLGLWDDVMKDRIIAANGSIAGIPEIPQDIRDLYKTVWEISQRVIIDMAAERGAFICQSQSMNIHLDGPTFGKLTSMHFYAWEKGLKTGTYYLRTKSATDAIKFTVDTNVLKGGSANLAGVGKPTSQGNANAGTPASPAPAHSTPANAARDDQRPPLPPQAPTALHAAASAPQAEMSVITLVDEPELPEGRACSLDDPNCESCSA